MEERADQGSLPVSVPLKRIQELGHHGEIRTEERSAGLRMGYVSCYCVICAGPVGSGSGGCTALWAKQVNRALVVANRDIPLQGKLTTVNRSDCCTGLASTPRPVNTRIMGLSGEITQRFLCHFLCGTRHELSNSCCDQ